MKKFKEGDLVAFSAGGSFEPSAAPEEYDTGIVVGVSSSDFYPYRVKWDSDGEVTIPDPRFLRLMSRPRPHADMIKAWADGAEIQYRCPHMGGCWYDAKTPTWDPSTEYRIKPSIPDPIVRTMFVEAHPTLDNAYNKPNLKLTFDGASFKLISAEIIEET